MKKILIVLSLICFVAVNFSNAQTPAQASTKKEVVATKAADESTPACHTSAKACCKKGAMKACTPEEKAKCAANKAKAEAVAEPKGSK